MENKAKVISFADYKEKQRKKKKEERINSTLVEIKEIAYLICGIIPEDKDEEK